MFNMVIIIIIELGSEITKNNTIYWYDNRFESR